MLVSATQDTDLEAWEFPPPFFACSFGSDVRIVVDVLKLSWFLSTWVDADPSGDTLYITKKYNAV